MAVVLKASATGKYHLCHPLIPAQEIFKATETDDPAMSFVLVLWTHDMPSNGANDRAEAK